MPAIFFLIFCGIFGWLIFSFYPWSKREQAKYEQNSLKKDELEKAANKYEDKMWGQWSFVWLIVIFFLAMFALGIFGIIE